MACSDYAQLIDAWTSYAWWDGIVCFYQPQLGASVIAFVFFGVTAMTLYMSTGSIIVPTVIGIVAGGVIFALLPALGIEAALVVIILVSSVAMYLLAKRSGNR